MMLFMLVYCIQLAASHPATRGIIFEGVISKKLTKPIS